MKTLISIFIGGGLGSIFRFYLGKWFNGSDFLMPYGTFTANVGGSFLIGLLTGLFLRSAYAHSPWAYMILVGFLGGFTTFSTFAYENFVFWKEGNLMLFIAYLSSTFITGLFAVAFGYFLSKFIM